MQACSYASYVVRRHCEGEVELYSFVTSALRRVSVHVPIHVPAALPLEIESSVATSLEAEGTDKWRAVVSTVMNRGVARSTGNFLNI
jgi:hypothetical protein